MRRLLIGLLGGATGLLPVFFFLPGSVTQLAFTGLLFGVALLGLGGRASWWRRVLALLLCSFGSVLAFLAAFIGGLLILSVFYGGRASEDTATFVGFLTAFVLAGATGGLTVACAWFILRGFRSTRAVRQSLIFGGVLAQAGTLPFLFPSILLHMPFAFFGGFQPLLTVWCAGMLILVDSWATDAQLWQAQPEPSAV